VSECDREASIMGRPWPTGGGYGDMGGGNKNIEQNLFHWFQGTEDLQKAELKN